MRLAAKMILVLGLLSLVLAGCSDDDNDPTTPSTRVPVVDQITENDILESNPMLSPDGSWYLYEAVVDGNHDIWRLPTAGGEPEQLTSDDAFDSAPVWSPDGSSIAFESDRSGNKDIWVLELDTEGAAPIQLTTSSSDEGSPAWARDNSLIAFESNQGKIGTDIFTVAVGGGDMVRVTTTPDYTYCRTAYWSPDSRELVYESDMTGFSALHVSSLAGGASRQITEDPSYEGHPAWSPDGTMIAYESTRAGTSQIFVVSPEGGDVFQVTTGGGWWPDWSADGTSIVYCDFSFGQADLWTVSVDW